MKNEMKKSILKTNPIQINRALNQFDGKILFPEKLKKANETLERIGIPKS